MGEVFRRLAHRVTLAVGSWQFFIASLGVLLLSAAAGPLFGFSDTWQLLVNTSTTILTYLLGILILLEANRQARESKVVHDEFDRGDAGCQELPRQPSTRCRDGGGLRDREAHPGPRTQEVTLHATARR